MAAYAATRMPATYAAVTAALTQAAVCVPDFQPASQLDIGGGTGAAIWAATAVWPSLRHVTVVERDLAVIEFGRRLAASAVHPAVRNATWNRSEIRVDLNTSPADLITLSYVLGELPPAVRDPVVGWLASQATTVAVIEPGTPDGHARVLAARDQLIGLGMRVAAPCPHSASCPLAGEIGVTSPLVCPAPGFTAAQVGGAGVRGREVLLCHRDVRAAIPPDSRVLRHPRTRKGLVTLTLCADGVREESVSKRHGDVYRAARNVEWGDPWL
ncbi:small ribosomal subunit Rsm22 family protein [Streptosporangium lutulentum]